MPLYDSVIYCNAGDQATTGYYAVARRVQNAPVAAGTVCRQFTAPAINSERIFICIVAGTTANVTDATWVLTRGARTTDGTVTWQECTGIAGLNGDLTNTVNWTQAKAAGNPVLGAVIKRNSGASLQICSVAGSMGASEPAFSDVAGTTTVEGTTTWTSLGPVGNFTKGMTPHARLNSAGTWCPAGGTVFVPNTHAKSAAANISFGFTGGSATSKILCHNPTGSYPPAGGDLTTGATVTTNGNFSITFSGTGIYMYGVALMAGLGTNSNSASITIGAGNHIVLDNCSLQTLTTFNGSGLISLGGPGGASFIILNNTTIKFSAGNQGINLTNCIIIWQNTPTPFVAGSTIPASALFNLNNISLQSQLLVEGVDLSAITATLLGYSNPMAGSFMFKDCKIATPVVAPLPISSGSITQLVRSDSGASALKSARYAYEGTETTELAVVRAGGSIDPTGAVQSRKILTSTIAQWARPFRAEPYAIWNSVVGSAVTLTLYGIADAAALPLNDELWIDIEYLGSGSSPLGFFATTTKSNILAVGAVYTADTSDWDNAATARVNSFNYSSLGVGTPIKVTSNSDRVFFLSAVGISAASLPGAYASAVDGTVVADGSASFRAGCRFKMVATITPGLAGYINVRVKAARPSTAFYIDPQIILS